jgi:hypothetical protein
MLVVLRVKEIPPSPWGIFVFIPCRIRTFARMRRAIFIIHFCLIFISQQGVHAQTLGGSSTFSFLKIPASPQLTALGDISLTVPSRDISLGSHNPSLLRRDMHGQVLASFNLMYAGIRQLHAMGGFHHERWDTDFSAGIQYLHYGEAIQTDPAGNVLGSFQARDYAVYLGASRRYLERWRYGATLKMAQSQYGIYRASGLLMDVGILYSDTARLLHVGFLARNMGFMTSTYAGEGEDLPFDLQLGVTKRLSGAPLQFSVTAHRLHQFDILYRDTTFNIDNTGSAGDDGFFTNLFRHFVFAAQGFVGDKVELTIGYNVLRRAELSITNTANGLTGFSYGVGVTLPRLQVRYAGSQYQNGTAFHQFGLNVDLAAKKVRSEK